MRTKIILHRSLILSVLLYRYGSWTATADLERRPRSSKTNATELGISYREHKMNRLTAGQYPSQISGAFAVKHHNLSWCGHVCRNDALLKIILHSVHGMKGFTEVDSVNRGRTTSRNGRASRCHHCSTLPEGRRHWVAITAEASVGVPQRRLGITGFD